MLSLGQRFRQQRELRKVSLDTVAQQTKISTRYLHAIETENFQELPSGLFRRSFIRQYALALDLDAEPIEAELDELFGSTEAGRGSASPPEMPPKRVITVDPMPMHGREWRRDRKLVWAVALLLIAIAACSGIYALWQRTQNVQAYRVMDAAPQSTITRAPQAPSPVRPEPSTPLPTTADRAAPKKLSVNLSANRRTWVRISSDGKTVFSGVLRARQKKAFQGVEKAKLMVSNAAAVEVVWNGKDIGPLGPGGRARVVEFTPENYRILSP